ncbi:MAG: hypothetical protein PQJ59_16805 [Spirochaetales bacterium]|nr:hypothetical protein [Spirochaetales bacterium]
MIEFKPEILTEKIAVHCDTEEKANALLEWADMNGGTWYDGESYLNNTLWRRHGGDTLYLIFNGTCCGTNHYQTGITIITYEEAILVPGENPIQEDSGDKTEQYTRQSDKFHGIYSSHEEMLMEKNKRYGDSALSPLVLFTKHITPGEAGLNGILVRLDDKLSRVKNSEEIRKNDISDILGYLILLCKDRGWEDFSDQVD